MLNFWSFPACSSLFPSHREGPRVVVTNGMVVPNYSSPAEYVSFRFANVFFALVAVLLT